MEHRKGTSEETCRSSSGHRKRFYVPIEEEVVEIATLDKRKTE
jgi:hypothetical protein